MQKNLEGNDPFPSLEERKEYGVTMIWNPDSPFKKYVPQLSEAFSERVPASWIPHPSKENFPNIFYKPGVFPGFVFKFRKVDPQHLRDLETLSDADFFEEYEIPKKNIRARYNIRNEFEITPRVRSVLSSGPMQEVISRYGFQSIELPEPILGVEYEKPQVNAADLDAPFTKGIVYEGIAGTPLSELTTEQPNLIELKNEIKSVFIDAGIYPSDISTTSIFVSAFDEKRLYLLDIEEFTR